MNIDYEPVNGKMEILIKVLKEDVNIALEHKYGIPPGNDDELKFLKEYIEENIGIFAGQKRKTIQYDQLSTDNEYYWLSYNCYVPKNTRKIIIKNILFLDLHYDQTNLLIFSSKDKQEGYTLDIRNQYVEIDTNK